MLAVSFGSSTGTFAMVPSLRGVIGDLVLDERDLLVDRGLDRGDAAACG
jgi:hypothetical protein